MTTKLKPQILEELDLGELSEEEANAFTQGFLEELDARVNVRLLAEMDDQQVKQMQQLIQDGDTKKLNDYKLSQFPNIDIVVQEEADTLKNEIKSIVDGVDVADELDYDAPPPPPDFIAATKGEV